MCYQRGVPLSGNRRIAHRGGRVRVGCRIGIEASRERGQTCGERRQRTPTGIEHNVVESRFVEIETEETYGAGLHLVVKLAHALIGGGKSNFLIGGRPSD